MRKVVCEGCDNQHPTAEMSNVGGRTLCSACVAEFVQEHGGAVVTPIKKLADPTICANCGIDGGDVPHGQLGAAHVCHACTDFFRNRPFPGWVRFSFAAVLVLVVVSFVWNFRFLQGHFEMKAAMRSRDLRKSAELSAAAAEHVPEAPIFGEVASFFQGMTCMQDDHCEEALTCFAKCQHLKKDWPIDELQSEAKQGAAFERKDYDQFLRCAEEAAKRHPNDSLAVASVASALACQYAIHGNTDLRKRAEEKIAEAKKLDAGALEKSDFEDRIRYRLETRKIIDRKEFQKLFPNGWKPAKESKTSSIPKVDSDLAKNNSSIEV